MRLSFIYIFLLILVFIPVNTWLFTYAVNKGKADAWRIMMDERWQPQGKFVKDAPVWYELEGEIVEVKPQSIILQKDGIKKEFDTSRATYTIVSPYKHFAEFHRKIVRENTVTEFHPGDQVNLLLNGFQVDSNVYLTRVMKIINK